MSKRLEMFDKLIGGGSKDPFHHYARALELRSLGRNADSLTSLVQVTEDYPDYVPSYLIAAQLASETSGVVQITSDLTSSVEGKHVILVEDIVDTGLTMAYLRTNLATRNPASVKLCALLHKPSRARVATPIDYLGFSIEDRFVVGYGLDWAERYRNLPYVGVVEVTGGEPSGSST